MIEHAWSVLCTRSVTDRESNNISLFEVIEQISTVGPAPPPGAPTAFRFNLNLSASG